MAAVYVTPKHTATWASGQAGGNGLVPCAISDRKAKIELYADMLRVSVSRPETPNKQYTARGSVTSFSRRSRHRMLTRLSQLRNVQNGWFVTLTFPDVFPENPRHAKQAVANLRKRIARQYPGAGGIWRLEFKERKTGTRAGKIAPHFHLLLFGIVTTSLEFRTWLRKAWFEVVGSRDMRHLYAGTQADEIKNRRHAMAYASKYAAKDNDDTDRLPAAQKGHVGRFWGMFGEIDVTPSVVTMLDEYQFVEMRRMVARWMKSRGRRYTRAVARGSTRAGFVAFGLGDSSWQELADPPPPVAYRMIGAVA